MEGERCRGKNTEGKTQYAAGHDAARPSHAPTCKGSHGAFIWLIEFTRDFDAERVFVFPRCASLLCSVQPYFHTCLIAYVLGLVATVAAMVYFKAAQPALFFLVPSCLGSTVLLALWRKGEQIFVARAARWLSCGLRCPLEIRE